MLCIETDVLQWEVGPRFVTVCLDAKLGAGGEDSAVGRLLQGFLKPLPLLFSQQGFHCRCLPMLMRSACKPQVIAKDPQ